MQSTKPDSDTCKVEIKQTRHILGLSGGKDSAALAIYLKDQDRDDGIEYFFCDMGLSCGRCMNTLIDWRTTWDDRSSVSAVVATSITT